MQNKRRALGLTVCCCGSAAVRTLASGWRWQEGTHLYESPDNPNLLANEFSAGKGLFKAAPPSFITYRPLIQFVFRKYYLCTKTCKVEIRDLACSYQITHATDCYIIAVADTAIPTLASKLRLDKKPIVHMTGSVSIHTQMNGFSLSCYQKILHS